MDTELKKILTKYAESDLKIARDRGIMGISETKIGLIEVKYEGKIYFINGQAMQKKDAVDFIVNNYVVVSE